MTDRYEVGGCGDGLTGCVNGDIAGESLCSTPSTGALTALLVAGGRDCTGDAKPPFAFGSERSSGGGVISPSSSGIGGQ